jgi:hypothetical protein
MFSTMGKNFITFGVVEVCFFIFQSRKNGENGKIEKLQTA